MRDQLTGIGLFFCVLAHATAQNSTDNVFTKELPQSLEAEAHKAMALAFAIGDAAKICNKTYAAIGDELQNEVTNWRKRNAPYLRATTFVANEISDLQELQGGAKAKSDYLEQFIDRSKEDAQSKVLLQPAETGTSNSLTVTESACTGLATSLRDGNSDFARSPNLYPQLVSYMKRKGIL